MFKQNALPPIWHKSPEAGSESSFIRNSKKAKSISLINQNRKQTFVHQTHLKKAFRKKFIHS